MKRFIFGMFLLTFGQISLNAQSDIAFEKVSICLTNTPNRCLSRARAETITENDPLTVEVILKSNDARLLKDQIQYVYVEAARMSPNCLRASSTPDNCPPDAYLGWLGLYTALTLTIAPPPLVDDADFIRPQLAATKKLRQEMLKIPVDIVENRPGLPGEKPIGRLDWPDNKRKPPYSFRFKANGMRMIAQNAHKYLRVTVTLRSGEKISSDHVRINVQ